MAASEIEKVSAVFVMISFLFETSGFTNNLNFIRFKWRLKRNHSPTKCVIHATEICQMGIRLKEISMKMLNENTDDVLRLNLIFEGVCMPLP